MPGGPIGIAGLGAGIPSILKQWSDFWTFSSLGFLKSISLFRTLHHLGRTSTYDNVHSFSCVCAITSSPGAFWRPVFNELH